MPILLTQNFHDIAPPVDYSLIPTWLVFVVTFVVLALHWPGRVVDQGKIETDRSRRNCRGNAPWKRSTPLPS